MTALYLIANEYRAAALQLADLDLPPEVVADTLESLSGELDAKAQSVAYMVRSIEADAASMKEWAKTATERAKAAEGRATALREYLARCMDATGIEKIEGAGVKLSFRKSSAVVIDGAELIPAEYMRTPEPPPPAPDKKLIGDAIKAGKDVPGASIKQRRTLVIA
jgi:hypothetical protein